MLANLEAKADLKGILRNRQLASKYNQGSSSRNQRVFLTCKEMYFEICIKVLTLHCLHTFTPPATYTIISVYLFISAHAESLRRAIMSHNSWARSKRNKRLESISGIIRDRPVAIFKTS